MSSISDEELYTLWTAGDEGAGQKLTKRRRAGVERVIRSLLNTSEAQDAVQEVFERLAQRARAGREVRHVKTFIAGVARNVVREHLRGQRKHGFAVLEHSLVDISPSQSMEIQRRETNHVLLKALHRMPIDDQILIALRYWENLRTKELAEVLELNHSTLRTRLARAEERLRTLVTELADSPEALESTIGSLSGWAHERHPRDPS